MVLRRAQGTWLVTGAAGGLGRVFAQKLRLRDEVVALWDKDGDALEQLRAAMPGQRIAHHVVDVRDYEAVQRGVQEVRRELGPIAHIVHAAGELSVGPVAAADPEPHRELMETNYLGAVHTVMAALPQLKEAAENQRRAATVLLLSSIGGARGFAETSAYCASKFALRGFAESLRAELRGTNVDVRLALPAGIDTPMLSNVGTIPPVYVGPRLEAEEVVDELLEALASTTRFALKIGPKKKMGDRFKDSLRGRR